MKTNMRSFSAAALVLTALLSESLSAQSERSRQRSGPIRSVPVAADIKRDVNFDCPEEFGYYPHPTDCTLYYVCVFGGALLESCTGGLMYSHELQTCDWPRNVGCDGASAAATGEEELERLIERDPPPPPPPPPRRTPPPSPPPPPPRAQPNPVVTSRGQPKFNRQEYEKQQQLYAEVDDLPPVEEIENDRQQRVYRGQPSTIGQVQKDRDGYGSQVVSSRTLNSNIIPASISQNSAKVGSFSFGTQVDERRAATATPIPQTYSEDKSDNVTDSSHDRQSDIETNNINIHDISDKYKSRKKREVLESVGLSNDSANGTEKITNRNDGVMEYEEVKPLEDEDFVDQEDVERGKRQIRYYTPKGYKNPSKNSGKPIRFVDFQQFNYNPNIQGSKYQPQYNGLSNTNGLSNYHDGTRKPYSSENNFYSTANPFVQYQQDSNQSQKPFKASLPDPFSQRLPHAPMNVATQIITKSPPISSLQNKENLFSSLAGGFFNNVKNVGNNQDNQNNNQYSQFVSSTSNPNNQVSLKDSSLLPSTIVTDKPVKTHTTSRVRSKYRIHPSQNANAQTGRVHIRNGNGSQKQIENRPPNKNQDYDDNDDDEEEEDDEDSDEDSDKEDEDDGYKHDFPEPPYEYTHYKFPEIENPFADPNFDFDAFLAKLRGDHYATIHEENETPKPSPKPNQNVAVKIINAPTDNTTPLTPHSGVRSSTLNYHGMSTPRPFSVPTGPEGVTVQEQNDHSTQSNTKHSQKFQKLIELPHPTQQNYVQHQHQTFDDNIHNKPHNPGIPLEAIIPKLKPPNFKDDRQLPITYNFQQSVSSTFKPNSDKQKGETRQMFTITQKPYIFITSTGSPIAISSPKQQFMVNPEKFLSLHPHLISSGKPYLFSTVKPHNALLAFKQSTTKPLTTLANEQLAALQYYWKNPTTEFYINSSPRPQTVSELPKLENLFAQAIKSAAKIPTRNQNYPSPVKDFVTTTTKPTTKRRPIPKPSPEMNDYYYDDEDEQYYYEPPVKSKYMPSTEIKPQRPPMAQNYQEYEDYEDSEESPENNKPLRTSYGRPAKYNSQKPDTATKNHNDVSVVTKSPLKDNKYFNGKIPVPVMIGYNTPAPNVLLRPDISNYQLIHPSRNRTIHFRKPMYSDSSPYTAKPPKYLNQTTLRPYTVRHRLAKPTTVKDLTTTEEKQIRGRIRHHNLVAMKLTTPRDNHNQETRFTKTKHDDKTNSLEPTAVTPSSFSASPRPKMLYNGSQSYNPDQYDPVYAVYDEDGELYKDSDYVQQYNTASLRPAVQQTYRGTPPPRRPAVQNYTPRPLQEDYDDALIHGQINNQNQYQAPIRHSTRPTSNRGRGSAHYSTLIGSDSPQQQTSHRGTPPTRSRPTLKPSTSVVTNNNPIIDIYANPPRRPAPVYPQPTPDKTAAKCRKDVCLLPDCFCGGKDIPGDLPVESVPQIVLLTFDDSVNDLNKGLYADLFEKDRVNPNGCPIAATFYVSHEWTDYSQVQNLYASGHEMASHTISHSFGEQFSQKKWNREVGGQREILSAYGGVKLEDVRGMRAPFLSVGGNKMFKMLHDSNFTYDSSLPVYENRPPSWPYTLDYKLFHDCMIPPCPTKSYPGVWEVPMVMWQDLNGGRCSMGDACANPPDAEGVYKMILKNFDRHYTTNRAPFGLYYHAAWFTQPHHKEGFIMFLDFINQMPDVWIVTNWQALQWVRDPTPISRLNNFQPFQCNYQDRPRKCNNPKVCNLWHKSGVRYMRTCQPCPDVYPWTGKTGIRSSRIDNEIEE
ncbi:uncharacterized protein LOC113230481 isoform X7 [Hyposmocoma kahamanoa]|uniref:uncharacterized protein LOC113230481 isoform X7 n=1 Tax=Hyposmocoma kahamanoa TaxID=1477025 RepID=UPI000E6D6435|nr:uncharacterized protein LOC113230481 isoform X7 [Hyposmocoma kahamanoa]